MKKQLSLLAVLLMSSSLVAGLASCGDIPTPSVQPTPTVKPTTPEASTPEVSTPEVSTPEVSTPEVSTPEVSTPESSTPEVDVNVITIAEAIEIATNAGESGTVEAYTVSGKIVTVSNATYGEMTIKDATGELYIYGVYSADASTRYDAMVDKPVAGDDITLKGILKTFKGKPEMDRGYMLSFTHNDPSENLDLSQYAEKSILEARAAADETKLIVSGTVAKITYAFGMKPNGFYLVDNQSSIYVYGGDAAAQVSVGNNVRVAAEKDYYILADEVNNANKHGYKGSNQLSSATLLSNDKGNNTFNLSWASETTMKDIMNTPVSNDITTNIFKVNALVKKVDGSDFVNYYFNDLDGYTGSYAYSQCSGSDFAWLDEFDGKICTVYISPINCKSTPSESFYRFIPIKVSYDNYVFDTAKAPEFALKYYALDQFKTSYEADPALEVVTSVSSELLNLSNVALTYSSSNEDAVYFETVEGKLVMHTKNTGNATVTITATYQTYTLTQTVEISVVEPVTYDTITIAQAIAAADNTEVTVQGIVTSSLINKTGFFISDDTGIIAVQVTTDELAKVEIGNMVILKGIRAHNKKETSTGITGQSNIKDATILVNLYGNHEYNDSAFDSTKTFTA